VTYSDIEEGMKALSGAVAVAFAALGVFPHRMNTRHPHHSHVLEQLERDCRF
jgi:hypothetical protein